MNQFACPSYNLHVQLLWYPMYYPEGMKARVSPVQWSKPYSILAPLRIWIRAAGFKIISGDHNTTTAHLLFYNKIVEIFSGDGASSDGKDSQSTKSHSSNKRKRKSRTAFTNQQIHELERRFLLQKYVTATDRDQIAESLGMTSGQVITWFQNRRAKLKRDLEELKADVTAAQTAALDTDPVATSGAIASTERRSGSISHLEKLICNTNSENKSTSRDTWPHHVIW